MLHALLASTVQPNVLHTVQQPYDNNAIHIAPTIVYTMHCYATIQLLPMQCTAAPSLVLAAGVEPSLAACPASGSAPLHHTNIHAAD